MRKEYICPGERIIDLLPESMIAESPVCEISDDEHADGDFEELSQKKGNFWDRDGIWK